MNYLNVQFLVLVKHFYIITHAFYLAFLNNIFHRIPLIFFRKLLEFNMYSSLFIFFFSEFFEIFIRKVSFLNFYCFNIIED